MSEIKKILVVGAGQMGAGIAQVAAQHSYNVFLNDASSDQLAKAEAGMLRSLGRLSEKAKISESPEAILGRIKFSEELETFDLDSIDLVIEAVSESIELKQKIFKNLDQKLPKKTIFASNTSSISITKLAAATNRPEKFVGMHFMNPVPLMKLVELIKGLATDETDFKTVKDVAEKMGKTCVTSIDRPGFIINRILMPMINEAAMALQDGVASVEDIDTGMKLGTNQPMGPLTLADFIGLDTCLAIMEVLHDGLGDSKYRAAPILKQYVDAGWLGRKSGRGFYQY